MEDRMNDCGAFSVLLDGNVKEGKFFARIGGEESRSI